MNDVGPARGIRWWARSLVERWSLDNVSLVAAGVAFYAMLSVVPALGVAFGAAAAIAGPDITVGENRTLQAVPADLRELVSENVSGNEPVSAAGLTAAAVLALALSLWSASGAAKHLVVAVNLVYSGRERRSYVRLRLLGLVLTAGFAAFLVIATALLTVIPWVLGHVDLGGSTQTVYVVLRWPVLAAATLLLAAVLYRIAPADPGRFRVLTPGTATATIVWLVGSVGFSTVVANATHFRAAYGSLTAVAAALAWFWILAAALIVGAQVDTLASRSSLDPTGESGAPTPGDLGSAPS